MIFSVFLVGISLQSFGRRCEKAAQSIGRTSANGSKQKAGFGEGTPQQVRPVSALQFQILKLWPQVDTCLSLFPSKMKTQISNRIAVSKAGKYFRRSLVRLICADERDTDREIQTRRVYERSECAVLGLNFVPRGILGGRNFCPAYAGRNGFPLKRATGTPIEVSPICGSRRLYRICVPAPVLQRRCPARPHFVRGRGAVSRSRRLVQFSKCRYEELQAGRPSANSLGI